MDNWNQGSVQILHTTLVSKCMQNDGPFMVLNKFSKEEIYLQISNDSANFSHTLYRVIK